MSITDLHLVYRHIRQFFAKESSRDGLRNTLAICVPAILLFYAAELNIAVAFAVGTLLSSLTDAPGNRADKTQTALWCTPLFFVASSATVITLHHAMWLMPILLIVFGFACSLLWALGSRMAAVGTLTLIVMSFTIGLKPPAPFLFSASFLAGTIWFFCVSLIQAYLKPYRSLQYAVRDGFGALAVLLRTKARCYDTNVPLPQVYHELSLVHIQVSEQLEAVRSLLLREPSLIAPADATPSQWLSRTYSLIDLYELLMAVDNDYETIREQLADTGALPIIRRAINVLSKEIQACDDTDHPISKTTQRRLALLSCLQRLDSLQLAAPRHVGTLIAPIANHLKHIQKIIEDIQGNLFHTESAVVPHTHYQHFIPAQPKANALKKQLTLRSPIFIYSLRMALLLGCGGLIGYLLPEYKYASWIILTIVLVARPSYSNTQRRNYQRIVGSVLGIAAGMALAFFIASPWLLLLLSAVGLYGFFLFNRPNYLVSVIFITITIILCLNIYEGNIWDILGSRLVFTLLGAAFAVLGCLAIPVDQRRVVSSLTNTLITDFQRYHRKLQEALDGKAVDDYELRLARKHAQTTLALFYDHAEQLRKDPTHRRQVRLHMNNFQSLAYRVHAHLLGLSVSLTKSAVSTTALDELLQKLSFIGVLLKELHHAAQQFSPSSK
ncbi:MAG TPA: FUSC family membrane protein [Sphingobacterium sp.]|jgi:uncharacterized membrane protein YccC|nr:FUSC family membrane protein [Sphingobacterium sp.]